MTVKRPDPTGSGAVVSVRFNDGEIARLDRLAGRFGKTRSAMVRTSVDVMDADSDRRRQKQEPPMITNPQLVDAIIGLRAEVRRIGVNFNQFVRAVHSGQSRDVNEFRTVLSELSQVADRVCSIAAEECAD